MSTPSKPRDKEAEVRNIFDELQKNAQIETGFGEKHEARRNRQIAPYVDRMGGWANYSYWIAVHGESHFNALTKAVAALKDVLKTTEKIQSCDHLRGRIAVVLREIEGAHE